MDRPGVKLQYRPGYYAVDRSAQEQRQLAALQKRMANAAHQPYRPESDAGAPGQNQGVIAKPKGGFDAAMELGAIPPTEIIFTAHVEKDDKVVKLSKKTPLPKDNYLLPEYKDKPFHNCTVKIATDGHSSARDENRGWHSAWRGAVCDCGLHHGWPDDQFAANDGKFRHEGCDVSQTAGQGLPMMQEIAVPAKGNYFLRIGVHDLGDDHVGALEIAVDEVHPEVAGQGSAAH